MVKEHPDARHKLFQQLWEKLPQFGNDLVLVIHLSSSPPAFPIIWDRRNGYEYHSSTLSCPIRPPPLTPTLSVYLLHESSHLVFCLSLQIFPGTGASNTSTTPL